jgi:hypothetical protein
VEWTVVTVVIALVGLFLTVGKPIISLNTNIVKLNVSLDALSKRADQQEHELREHRAHAHESHQRLWAHNMEQDEKLAEHEKRIVKLEGKD